MRFSVNSELWVGNVKRVCRAFQEEANSISRCREFHISIPKQRLHAFRERLALFKIQIGHSDLQMYQANMAARSQHVQRQMLLHSAQRPLDDARFGREICEDELIRNDH